MSEINLDELRAARREANAEPIVFILSGERFQLPVELPFEAAEKLADMASTDDDPDAVRRQLTAIVGLMKALLGSDWDRFLALDPKPSMKDIEAIADKVLSTYGVDSGNSPASPTS